MQEEQPIESGNSVSQNKPLPEAELHFGRLLGEVNRKLSDGHDFVKILDFMFESLNVIIPYDRIGIALVEEEAGTPEICLKWVKSKIPTSHIGLGYCAPLKGSSLEKILETGRPRIINDLVAYGREHPNSKSTELILKDGIRSSLTCPLRSEGKAVGIAFFSSFSTQTYKNEHIETYLKIADELSVVIEHGRLRKWFNSDLSRGQNLRMLLHDLKNPLNVIQGFLELSQQGSWYQDLDSDAKNIFLILKRNSSFMGKLLDELSELSKLGISAGRFEPREITLREFVENLSVRARELTDRKEISIEMMADSRLPEMACFDGTQISRVMDNLISNAVKFSKRGTKIQITIKRQRERLVFEVSDEGQGIPESELPKLFLEFGRTNVLPTEGEQSTGLGLAIARKIVEQHGGRISVRSQVGKGSTFVFWLPLTQTFQ